MSFIGNSHGRLAEINKREIISDNSEVVERIKNLSYKNTLKRIPLNPNCEFVDILGNKYESKAEVNISNAMISIEWLTGVKLEFYHPDVIRFSDVNITREKFIDLVKPELLKMAGWDTLKTFPYYFLADYGFKKYPELKIECWGGYNEQYKARRKIKELFYNLCNFTLISIERNEDANFPFLIEKLIKELHLRKRKEFRNKL